MKKLLTLFAFISSSTFLFSQAPNPVSWTAQYHKISATEGEIVISAAIEKKWHTYSQKPTDDGPIPTSFTFTPAKGIELVGKTEESPAHEEFVPAFGAKIFVYTDKAEFRQKVKTNGKAGALIPIRVEFMSCNDMMCLPPKTVELSVKTQ